jgi:PLP dependent protein
VAGLSPARVRENAERIRAEIDEAARRAGRDAGDVELLAAVKYVERDDIGALLEAGVTLLGENRAQELEAKAAAWPDARWHFIGQLQSRKVKQILPLVELIHSVASDSALRQLERHGTPETQILVEVNVAEEEGKAGIPPGELDAFLARTPVRVAGLMGMPPFAEDPEQSRPHFAALRELAETHGLRELSMGTSQDYAVAVEEGATIVRVGSVLFG